MHYATIGEFLSAGTAMMLKTPTALIFAEDEVELASSIDHALGLGFGKVAVFCVPSLTVPLGPKVVRIDYDVYAEKALVHAVNLVIATVPGAWLHYCYNAEYLFYPFCETRTIGDFTTFLSEERRASALTYVVDLYAADLTAHPDAVDRGTAMLDALGYYALSRLEPGLNGAAKDRQMDFFGGLRWRFEEHIPWERRRIDRVAVFRAEAGLVLHEDHTFSNEEYNTYACPWHNNPTAALCSFRTAKALRRNPGSRAAIHGFSWRHSQPFDWQSQQLLQLGLIEPGQWF